jgi:hypothetical protein
MPKHFQKKCSCHGKAALVSKKKWKAMKRTTRGVMVCASAVFESKVIFTPYIPLLKPIRL